MLSFETTILQEYFGSGWTWGFLLLILTLILWMAFLLRRLRQIKDHQGSKIQALEKELVSWHRDDLTGLLSKRMFMEQAKHMFGVVFRHLFEKDGERRKTDHSVIDEDGRPDPLALVGREMSMVFFDIDHFKRVNDTFGHPIGDVVLEKLGEIINSHVRHGDHAGRYGGEEFVVALSSDVFGAQAFIRRIRKDLALTTFISDDKTEFQITISGGLVQLTRDDQTLTGMINQADDLLYMAKKAGRDRYFMLECGGPRERTD